MKIKVCWLQVFRYWDDISHGKIHGIEWYPVKKIKNFTVQIFFNLVMKMVQFHNFDTSYPQLKMIEIKNKINVLKGSDLLWRKTRLND